jgi:hypothetical protein
MSLLNDCLDLHSVGWVCDQIWKFLSHANLSQVEALIKVGPELAVESFGGQNAGIEITKSNGIENSFNNFESFNAGKV